MNNQSNLKKPSVYDVLIALITLVICFIFIDFIAKSNIIALMDDKQTITLTSPWHHSTQMLKAISLSALSLALVIEWHRRRQRLVIHHELTKKDMQKLALALEEKYKGTHTRTLNRLIEKLNTQSLQKKDLKTLTHHLNKKVPG